MRTTQIISLFYDNGTSASDPVNISVPFDVKHVYVKGIGYLCAATANRYCYVTSDLFENTPLGLFHDDALKPMNTYNNICYEFRQPRSIAGTYQFTLHDSYKSLVNVPADAVVGIIMEFVSDKSDD